MKWLSSIKYLITIIVAFTMLNALAYVAIGVMHGVKGYIKVFKYVSGEEVFRPGLYLVESLDIFLIAIVMIIIAGGIAKLFIYHDRDDSKFPEFLGEIKSLKDLKVLLWEAILVVLVVGFVVQIAHRITGSDSALNWELMVLPGCILILAMSLFIMKKTS